MKEKENPSDRAKCYRKPFPWEQEMIKEVVNYAELYFINALDQGLLIILTTVLIPQSEQ